MSELAHCSDDLVDLASASLQFFLMAILEIRVEKNARVAGDLNIHLEAQLAGAFDQPLVHVNEAIVGRLNSGKRIEGNKHHDCQQCQHNDIAADYFFTDSHSLISFITLVLRLTVTPCTVRPIVSAAAPVRADSAQQLPPAWCRPRSARWP